MMEIDGESCESLSQIALKNTDFMTNRRKQGGRHENRTIVRE